MFLFLPLVLACASNAFAAVESEMEYRPPVARRMAGAALLTDDVMAVTAMAAKGNELYAQDSARLSWRRYCGMSRNLAEAGEFRAALQAAIKSLHLGESTGDVVASAFATREIAFTYVNYSQLLNH